MPQPDPQLVEMFRAVRSDARNDPTPTEIPRVFTIDIGFDGGGLVPSVGQCQVLPLGLIKARIVGAAILANGVGSAVIDIRHGTFSDAAAGLTLGQLYGPTGAIPTITNAAAAFPLDIRNWTVNLQPNDVLIATLKSVSSILIPPALGAMTSLTLSLSCRHIKWPAGSTSVIDSSGNTVTDSFGNIVIARS